jgi:hypothetical protein
LLGFENQIKPCLAHNLDGFLFVEVLLDFIKDNFLCNSCKNII